ncbi:AraC family transcriptional regulator [Simiduia sp. 21SJ11W-1]|uniref:helix-turn-helix domain-containing protein n=1 Tax=Simiduia sp. 21SJ11W-1 TaxID=2909669 RepID=UPI00209F184A|nr:AraC family transcriptional regulator [Simiduia sp. 21SJ11W-1]UTA47268.1 AraC family transcriptional regulator [Simiduia sp. 21SJ11W-1]
MQFSSYGNWVKPIPQLLRRYGADGDALLTELGIECQPDQRIPVEKTAAAWRRAAETIGEPAIGLLAAEAAQPASWGELGLAVMCSESLAHAIALLLKYPAFISDSIHISTHVRGDEYVLEVVPATPQLPGVESLEFGMATGFQLLRAIFPGKLALRSLALTRTDETDLAPYRDFYGCSSVTTKSPIARQVYALADIHQPLPFANETLVRHHEALLQQQLVRSQPQAPDLIRQTLNAIRLQMAAGDLDQTVIARQLNMSPRHLQRKLKARELRFTDLVDQVRRDHALNLLRDGQRSLTEIAHLLGFSDHSNFTRAFKRWFGKPPTQYLS